MTGQASKSIIRYLGLTFNSFFAKFPAYSDQFAGAVDKWRFSVEKVLVNGEKCRLGLV